MSQICGEMTELFDKRLKNVENDLEIWETSLGNGLDTGARLKCLKNKGLGKIYGK